LAGPSSTHRQVALRSSRVAKGRHERHRSTLRYPGFRFPAEIIGHGVWLYHRFTLSFRDIEDLLAEREIIVTHETIRQWCLRFGQEYANSIRRRRRYAPRVMITDSLRAMARLVSRSVCRSNIGSTNSKIDADFLRGSELRQASPPTPAAYL
jgi:hypothetical protein